MNAILEALTSLGFDWHVALANLVNFFIIFFILKHFFFGSIQKTLAERKEKIQKGLDDAEKAAHLLENADEEQKQIIKRAEIKASEVLSGTEKKSAILAESIKQEAENKSKQILLDAEKNVAKQHELSLSEIQTKAPAIIAEALEKILNNTVTQEVNENYVKTLIAK